MFFVYIASMLSRYTLQVNKSLLLSNQPTKNTEVVNLNTHKKVSNKKIYDLKKQRIMIIIKKTFYKKKTIKKIF